MLDDLPGGPGQGAAGRRARALLDVQWCHPRRHPDSDSHASRRAGGSDGRRLWWQTRASPVCPGPVRNASASGGAAPREDDSSAAAHPSAPGAVTGARDASHTRPAGCRTSDHSGCARSVGIPRCVTASAPPDTADFLACTRCTCHCTPSGARRSGVCSAGYPARADRHPICIAAGSRDHGAQSSSDQPVSRPRSEPSREKTGAGTRFRHGGLLSCEAR